MAVVDKELIIVRDRSHHRSPSTGGAVPDNLARLIRQKGGRRRSRRDDVCLHQALPSVFRHQRFVSSSESIRTVGEEWTRSQTKVCDPPPPIISQSAPPYVSHDRSPPHNLGTDDENSGVCLIVRGGERPHARRTGQRPPPPTPERPARGGSRTFFPS